jgi:hypothetical protein
MSLTACRWSWTRACPAPALCPESVGRDPPARHPPQAYTDHSRKLTGVFGIRDLSESADAYRWYGSRSRDGKTFREPKNRFQGIDSASLCSLAAGTTTLFPLGS